MYFSLTSGFFSFSIKKRKISYSVNVNILACLGAVVVNPPPRRKSNLYNSCAVQFPVKGKIFKAINAVRPVPYLPGAPALSSPCAKRGKTDISRTASNPK
jgi:hypothetical protein